MTPHDAPPAMAMALILLAVGSIFAGFIGIPHALGGHNVLGTWLEPVLGHHAPAATGLAGMTIGECVVVADASAAQLPGMTMESCAPAGDVALAANVLTGPSGLPVEGNLQALRLSGAQPATEGAQPETHAPAAADEHAKEALELQLMVFSSLLALLGIGVATYIWLKRPEIASNMAARFPAVHRVLLNKYYVDELYDVTVVQPVRIVSEDGLWRGMDARLVDGAVNGTGQVVGGLSAVMRLLQSGSVKAYAASTFLGVVAILAYYLWR